ncbi:MAG: methyl-accepting chemotaxis protein [Bdellovibrionaceae bacterium]|nr:methyl-accepting chemotaxis protein [Pseudobdellovibrionaceae bacterium]
MFLLLVGAVGRLTIDRVTRHYGYIERVHLPQIESLARMRVEIAKLRLIINDIVDADHTSESLKDAHRQYDAHADAFHEAEKEFQATLLPAERDAFEKQRAAWEASHSLSQSIFDTRRRTSAADWKRAQSEYEAAMDALDSALQNLASAQAGESQRAFSRVDSAIQWGGRFAILAIAFGFAVSLATGYVFSRKLSRHLDQVTTRLAAGAQETAQSAADILATDTKLSGHMNAQAATLQEIVTAVDEISATVARNSDNAKQSQMVSQQSHASAIRGQQAVSDVIRAIGDISQSNAEIMSEIEKSNQKISEIVKVIAEIGGKTKVINDIVFQTKLLSFNASVEAARAGEHGKGFAVVAEEVGNLAQMSGAAAKEIASMLDESIHKVESIVQETKVNVERLILKGREKVDAGTSVASRCGEALQDVVTNVEHANRMIGEIATAGSEQAIGIAEINKAMGLLDQSTQQTATSSRQSAAASQHLSAQTIELRNIVDTLLRTVQGGATAPAPQRKAEPPAPQSSPASTKNTKVLPMRATATKPKSVGATGRAAERDTKAEVTEKKAATTAKPKEVTRLPVNAKPAMAKAAGADFIPSEHDPRFEDI